MPRPPRFIATQALQAFPFLLHLAELVALAPREFRRVCWEAAFADPKQGTPAETGRS
jgi:hypothetical protein